MNGLTKAASDVLAERKRQIEREGWTPEHDNGHGHGSMALAAACYAAHTGTDCLIESRINLSTKNADLFAAQEFVRRFWPWDWEWWKPKDRRRNLVRAAALLLAEIERLDRAANAGVKASDGKCLG
jgi:hypothetical protein